jgi:prepilin-type N-terminal cleavage/methylation domain-containing protein
MQGFRLKRRGFTLIELMFGVLILLVVIIAALLSFIHSMLLNEASNNLTIAVNDAQYVLEQIKALDDYDDIPSYTPPTLNNLINETITLNRTIGTNISTITVNVSWQERQNTRSFSLATCIAK